MERATLAPSRAAPASTITSGEAETTMTCTLRASAQARIRCISGRIRASIRPSSSTRCAKAWSSSSCQPAKAQVIIEKTRPYG
jgi:hypothetical protein